MVIAVARNAPAREISAPRLLRVPDTPRIRSDMKGTSERRMAIIFCR
jgi:hypothetical protein